MRDHRRLEVWRLAHDLTLEVYAVTRSFPAHERFGLANYQLLLARDLGYIDAATHVDLTEQADRVRRKLARLRTTIVGREA